MPNFLFSLTTQENRAFQLFELKPPPSYPETFGACGYIRPAFLVLLLCHCDLGQTPTKALVEDAQEPLDVRTLHARFLLLHPAVRESP